MSIWWIISILCIISFFIWASSDIKSRIYLSSICRGETQEKIVALTFDDGPDPIQTPKILDVLRKNNISATFFLVGEKARAYPDLVYQIYKDGHIIGNHTNTHKFTYPLWSVARIKEDLQLAENIIYKIINRRPKLFRPPFGVTNPHISKAVQLQMYISIGWDVRSLDTIGWKERKQISHRVIKKMVNGSIILMHDRCSDSEILLTFVLDEIEKNDFKVVPLDELLKINVYED